MIHRMFVAFAGGGAKALIHLGALRALEARGVEFKGLAGTSAGALVATLKAAGFTASELLNVETGESIVAQLGEIDPKIKRAVHFFGPMGWLKILIFRAMLPRFVNYVFGFAFAVLAIVFVAGQNPFDFAWYWTGLILAGILGPGFLLVRVMLGGLADSKTLCNALAVLLQQKIFPAEPGRIVKMRDFGHDGRPALKIVSANLTSGRLQLFSGDRTPEVSVADAVAASISLPIIFRPKLIDGDLHMDGGIVSNLPAWPFDEERELDPEATTLAIEIETATERRLLTRFNWLSSFIQTGLFGSAELNLRAAGRTERMVLSTQLKLLQFDLATPEAIKEVIDAERAAQISLDRWLFKRPEMYRDACKTVKALVDDVLETVLDQDNPGVRVAIAMPDRDYFRSLRLRYATEYDDYHDEGLLIPIAGTVAGQAWSSSETRFEVAPLPAQLALPGPENRLRRKALRVDLKWLLCVPISNDAASPPRLIVQIDGGQPMPDDGTVDTVITQIENDVKEFFGLIIANLNELEN